MQRWGTGWDICYLLAICQNIFHRKLVDENRILLDSKRECVWGNRFYIYFFVEDLVEYIMASGRDGFM